MSALKDRMKQIALGDNVERADNTTIDNSKSSLRKRMEQIAGRSAEVKPIEKNTEVQGSGTVSDADADNGYQKLYERFRDRIVNSPSYHVAPVVDSWDKSGIAESELWKTEDEYKKDASAITSEMQSAYGKYAKGEMSDADINILADKYQRFAAKEKAYFSDRYQKTGTLATADALKLRRDAARDANAGTDARIKEIDMEVANARRGSPEYFQGLFAEKAALENSKTNVDYKDTEGKYYSALQFEAEKDVSDKYDGYKAEYGKNGVDYANKSGSFEKVDGMKTEKVSYKGASDFLAKYTDAYKTNIDSNIRELNEYGTDEQKNIFLQLFTEKGYKDALNYAKDIHPLISKQAAKIQGEKYEDSNALERFGMGVGAVFEGGIGDIGQSITGLGKALFRDTSYTHRNTAQQKADAVIEAEQNPVADLLMQAGRSAVANSPSIIVGVATGGSSLASTPVLFASAAGSAYVDAINKGNGYFNALGYGIANGAIEAATEKLFDVPGFYGGSKVDDAFKGIISKSVRKLSVGTKSKTALNFLGYMTANGFGEAVEEGITAAVEPTLGNIFLGEKNESFTAEHFGEIGYAALLGTVSSFLMPLSYVSTYADAKGDTAVQAIFNGEKITDKQIDTVVGNESSRELFEKIMGFELSGNYEVAKAQVMAVADSVAATKGKSAGTDVSSVLADIKAGSVAEYAQAITEYITEPDAEYVANETAAVAEMTEIANDELAKISTGAVQRIIEGTANSNDYHAVSKDAEARAEFTKMTGVELSAIPGEARSQMRAYASQKASDSPSETIAAVADQAVEETVSDLMDGVSAETASINEGVEADGELADYGVSDRQAALERAVDGDGEIARLKERYENGEMSEAEYNEAVTRRASEIERSISESDGDVSEVDSVPVADGVTENGGTSIMSKDDFDIVRNNSYSVTRNSAKDIKSNPIFAKVSAAEIRAFRAVGKALGVDVKAFDGEALGLTGTDGAYDNKTRTIYLNVTSPLKAISSAFRHEVIHYLKVSSPKAYGEFAAFVIDKYKAQYSNEDYNAWLEAKREEYEAMGETLTRDGAEEEFLAQFGMDMLQQKAIARDFVRHHRSTAMKVWDAIRNLINKIRRFYGMQELPTSVYDAISQLAENTSGQIQVYGDSYTRSHLRGSKELLPGELNIDALNAADEALLNAFVEVANINKSIQAKLKNAPEDVLNDDVKRAQYIEELWAEETGVEVDNNEQIRYNKYWHTDLTKAEVIELSRIIRRDIRTSQNAITDTANWLFTQVNGKDVFAIYSTEEYNNPTILYESQKSKARFEHNYILNLLGVLRNGSNTHGKSDIINQILASSRVRNIGGVDNNAKNVARRSGNRDGGVLQRQSKRRPSTALRSVLENLYEIRDRHGDGNRGRVDADNSVNTSDEKKSLAKVDNEEVDSNGAKLTEGQVEYFKDSKIRDKNGNLLVMYHGTNAEFSVFEKGTKNGWLGKGIYFSDSKKYARKNGKNIFVVYLDVKNPFLVKGNDHYALLSEAKELFPEVTEMNVAEVLKNNGYDGIVLNDWDQGTIISVFEPEQIKLTSNKNPTSSKDVKFSMSKPVEQTKDLIAVHNLNSPKLRKALELGGFPMPSIAVTRANMGHDKFGDITLVFGRDTIDPAVNSDNKLYGGDAYTPTFPAVRYEANRNKVDELSTLYDDMRKRFGADEARPLYVYSDYSNAADTLNRNGGEEGVIDYLKGDTNLMQLFLLDKTGNKVDTVMKRTEVKASDEDVKEYEFWLNELGKDFFDGLTPPTGVKYTDHARQYFEENKSTVLKTFSKMLTELYGYNAEEANNAVINSPESEFKSTLRRVYLYNKNGSVTVKEEPDYTATREQITKTAKAKGYDKWVEDTFKGIEGKKGIRNDKDPFTPSGKRRSFEDLHFDYTLDNIVRAMKQKKDKGISLLGGSIVGASAKNYKSVAQMKADSARLKQISQNEYDDIQKGFRDRFRELAVRLANGNDSIDAGNLMAEAVAKYNTPSAIKNYIARESRGIYNYNDDIGNELLDIVNGIANMPTGYFEAKPKRAVGFDEVKYAVVPESIDADLRNGLEAVGTKVVTYKDGDSADRLEKLNSDSGVKFSKARVDNGEDSGYNDDTNFVKDGVNDAKTSDDGRTVQTDAVFSRGIHGVYDGNRDNARGNTDNSADLSVGNTAVELHSSDNKSSQTRKNTERSGERPSLGTLYSAKSSSQESGTGTYERGYREAVESNNLETARKILDEYAESKGFVPVNVYHGTSSQSVFTEFKNNGKAVWVTPNLEYAGGYSEGYYGNDIKAEQLFTEPDSAIFDLYFKPGKTLDVGYINKEVKSGNDLAEFANKIGVDLMDIMPAWINGRKTYEDNRLWVITISREFADLARKLGYDSLKAVEGNVNNGITTYGILYPENVKSSKTVTYDNDGNIIPLSERFNDKKNDVRWSKSSPDSSDTAYIPKGEKPKSSTASIAALAKRNAVLNKRLADAKNQLKLTKAYSPEPGEIDALAQRIASEYNDGDNVMGIKNALTGIYRLWNEGKVTGDEYKLKQANREIASLAQDIMFGEDANVPSTEANNKAISQFADMLSTEIAFVAEAEPTFADKAKSLLEYEREMAEIDKKEAVAKERLKAAQAAFEKAEKAKDKAVRQGYVELWKKELDKLDKQKANNVEKGKKEAERLRRIASTIARKDARHSLTVTSSFASDSKIVGDIADALIETYDKSAGRAEGSYKYSTDRNKVVSILNRIFKAQAIADYDTKHRQKHLDAANKFVDKLAELFTFPGVDTNALHAQLVDAIEAVSLELPTAMDMALQRGEDIPAEINILRNARNAENAEETDARINELRKEYAEVKASVASDGIKSIIENTVKWSGKSVESLINTAVRLERQLQKDIAKQKIDDIRRRGTESKERQRLLKLMQRLKRVKTKPELMAAISEIIGDYDTVAVNITGRKVTELGTIQDEFLAEQKRLIVEGEAPKIMTQALKDKLARLDNKKIGDMSIEEVRSLTEALLEIETRVKAEKKLLNDEFKQTTKAAGRQIIKELNHEKAKGVDADLAKKKNNGKYDHLRARTFFLNLCGYNENSTLYKLFDAILEGRRNTLLYKQTQDNRLSPWTKDKEYMKTIIGKDAEGIDIGGGVKVNKASLIALYLHSMNDDNMSHIEHGGIEIPDFDLMKKGEIKEAYEKMERVFLTKSEIYALCQKHLNEKDKNLANAIRVYFNEVSKKVLNEVLLKVYGYEKFNVENYFPIRVDANFLNSDGTDIFDGEGNINILESGFAQERQKGAITPMLLVDALTVFDRSVNDHALYANLAIPLRDMKAAFGVRVVSKTDGGDYRVEASVWDTLTNNYGSDAEIYIKDFWQNLQGKTVKELGSNILSGAIGRLATSALYLNEQSALKQFTAYPVALAVLDTKSLGKALKDIGKIDEAKLERYNRYTPWLVHRSEGLSDATIADLRQGKKNHKWANWLQYTDVLTSKKLLKACEYYVKDNYKDIKPDTDAFYKKVAEKFNEVIEQTQQNNDVVSKTRRLNNQSGITRMFTVFKSQNYQQLNMYIEAQGRVEAKELAYKNNKDSAVAKEAFEDAKLKRTRTVAGSQLSVAMNIAISLAMLLLRGRWDELDKDKDGKVEALEVLGNVVSRYFDEQSSMFLFGDVVSYAKDVFTGGTPFTPSENPVIEPIINIIDKSSKLVGEVEQWIKDGKFNGYELFSAVKGLSVETLKSLGVPAGNAYNLLTTSAYGSSFLLTGGSNDFAQIIRHTIKGDLISKSGNADNYTINKDVKLALFRLLNAKGREVEFERATGILNFAGATEADIYKAIANGYSIKLSDNDVNKIEYLKAHFKDKRGLTYYFDVKKLAKSIDVNDNINQEEAKKAIDMLAKKHPDISNDVKAILWQMFNKSWGSGNNPYSKKIGAKCKSEMGWD